MYEARFCFFLHQTATRAIVVFFFFFNIISHCELCKYSHSGIRATVFSNFCFLSIAD